MMKIKLMLLGAALLLGKLVHAQNEINLPAMTSMLPAPPNATELTKYSGVPVNLSTGGANVSIPLGEVKQGKLSVPITLSYSSGNGIKVDQIASRAGMGWVLNAGGVISRSVAGNPDESSTWRKAPASIATETDSTYNFLYDVTHHTKIYDSEPDIFSFNFNGYSGQFILNPGADRTKAVLLTPSPLKIETNFAGLIAEDWTIRITDPNGTQYSFGGSTATEKTKTSPYGGNCGRNYENPIPTSWYLVKIKHYGGDEIDFTYTPVTYDYYTSVSETFIRTPSPTLSQYYNVSNLTGILFIVDPKNMPTVDWTQCGNKTEYQICASRLTTEGVLLMGINSKNYSVSFSYTERMDVEGDYLFSSAVFSTGQTYNFTYANSANNRQKVAGVPDTMLIRRPFLMKLTGPIATEEHNFHYYDKDLMPARLSFSQDFWGYYNDKNNTYLVPKHKETFPASIFPNIMADRTPDGTKSKYGLLSRIIYPSGGNDSLLYEPNTVYEYRVVVPPTATISATIQGSGSSVMETETINFSSVAAQNITLNFSCVYDGVSTNDGIHQHSIFKLYDPSNMLLYTHQLDPGQTYSTIKNIGSGLYKIVIESYGEAAIGTAEVNAPGYSLPDNYEVGGVRLAKNISTPVIGTPLLKKIVYAKLSTQTQSSGKLRYTPNPNDYYADLPIFNGDDVNQCHYITAYTNPKNPLNYYGGGHIFYEDVIELKSDTWEDGGVAHHYMGSAGFDPLYVMGVPLPGVSVGNYGFEPGIESNVRTFKVTGGTSGAYVTAPVQEVSTHYKQDSRLQKEFDIYTVRKKWTSVYHSVPHSTFEFRQFDVAMFTIVRKWHYPDTVTTTTYDEAGTHPVVTKQVLIYNDTTHMQVNEVQQTRSDGKIEKITFKYPAEMYAGGGGSVYNDLNNQNRRTIPVVKSRYVGADLAETVTTNYTPFTGNIIEPASVQYKQGAGATGDFVTFSNYDSEGKLLTQSLKYGPKISYQYGYKNSLVIAECKNALVTEFYHNNFEDISATTGAAHTGVKYNTGSYTVSWTPPVGGRAYRLSYWYLDGSTWKLQEQAYTGTSAILALGSAVDDICIFPADAMIKTYTYNINAGVTSIIDEKGLTAYFEYDDHNRLQNVKDKDGNILKNYKYHLAN